MKKNNIRIVVQDTYEGGADFGQRIETICDNLITKYKVETGCTVSFTSTSDGRHTAIIQFVTDKEIIEKSKSATFNGSHLREAYNRFLDTSRGYTAIDFQNFLLEQVIEDY